MLKSSFSQQPLEPKTYKGREIFKRAGIYKSSYGELYLVPKAASNWENVIYLGHEGINCEASSAYDNTTFTFVTGTLTIQSSE